ncbi:nuclease/helicase [Bordetella trematum]|uniref:UvrD-helicase domain-containing protein n=1 Tax=Bordetella trematum TaxID=123899 RepID=UPI00052F0521|nr:UvrD-helicase domain-containing protein [Bordetella trematum]QIM71805.1 nuclease [Bordetella trematum]SAI25842.1 nuclease/helicase [Bordetella trematum]
MSERQPQDHAQRLRALDPQQSFLVQAPAGSGKTELLTDRILALLATVNRPEEIVAITFTRKAASEMHARVLEKLALASGPEPASAHEQRSWLLARRALARDQERGWRLLQHPARLAIRTIDAFCAGLVRGMPWLSGLGGMPEIADDAMVHYEAAASATLALADEHPSVVTLLAHMDVDVGAAQQAIAAMLGQRDQWLPLLRYGLDREGVEAGMAETLEEELLALRQALPVGCGEALCESARRAAAELEGSGDTRLRPLLDWTGALSPQVEDLPRWHALAHLLLTGTGGLRSPKGVTKNLGFPAKSAHKEPFVQWLSAWSGDEAWVARLAALRSMPPATFSDEQWEVLSAQLVTLALAVAQLQQVFAQAGEVDFIEINQRAQRALGSSDDPGELLLKLDASIRHLLVDEFQDTSQTQIDLLVSLTAGWQPGDGRSLFLVGDPMQSIYRFRKAEVGLFLRAAAGRVGEVELEFLQLTDNFRSQGGVVEWVNRCFSGLLPAANDAAAGAIRYSASAAFHPALEGPAVTFHPAWAEGSAADGEAAAEEIALALVRQALAEHPDSAHPVAILVRARSHLGSLSRRLAQEGIPCRAVELVPLRLRPVVADLVQLLRALSHPGDRMAWLSVLRSPCCGLTLTSLQRLFGEDHDTPVPQLLRRALAPAPAAPAQAGLFDAPDVPDGLSGAAERLLSPEECLRLRRVADILLDRGNEAGAWPLAAWLQHVWQALGGAGLYSGVGAAADAESLFQLIERLAPHGGLDLAVLDAAVARLFAAPDVQGGQAAVEIMTMHKSKGLQFDTVILYGLHRAPRADTAPLVRFEHHDGRVLMGPVKPRAEADADPVSRYLGAREARRAAYETDRLLYVAATRARKRLRLVGNLALDRAKGEVRSPPPSSLLGRLWPYVRDGVAPGSVPDAPVAEAQPAWQGEPLKRLDDACVARWVAQGRRRVAPGGLAAEGEHPGWQLEAGYDAAVGTLAHAWLARMGEQGRQAWDGERLRAARPAMRRQLTRAGIPDSQADRAADAVLQTLLATLDDERGRWLLSQSRARREWPLIDASGRVSVIDLALSTEDGWLIVDYKTGQPGPGETAGHFAQRMRLRHGEQLQRYCAQVSALDGRAARAALYFPRARAWIDL